MNPRAPSRKDRVESWLASLPGPGCFEVEAETESRIEGPPAKRARRDVDDHPDDNFVYAYNMSPPLTMDEDDQMVPRPSPALGAGGRKRAADEMDTERREFVAASHRALLRLLSCDGC